MKTLTFKALTRWRDYIQAIVEALEKAAPEARIYIAGGAAKERLTALSDIDIVIALDHKPSYEEAVNVRVKIWEELDKAGLPAYLPLDIHIVGVEELKRYDILKPLKEKKNFSR